tara:strand:+ start:1118 stop:1699 length:582 start_codon:yes stop_codon:yes gene_type:complete
MELQKVNINKIYPNPVNPRIIKSTKFKKLVKSINQFPEMLKLRPIVVNNEMGILGGNMRYKACQELGMKDVFIIKANDLTEKQMEQFVIKDNASFGEWDWDILANSWSTEELSDWGLDVWQPEESVSNEKDYSINSLDQKLDRFLDAKIKNITIPFETGEFAKVVEKLEILLTKYKCQDYRALIYKIIENEKI